MIWNCQLDVDLVRCFLAFCEEVSASPSAIRLLVRLIEHSQTTHLFTLAESKTPPSFLSSPPPLNVQTLQVSNSQAESGEHTGRAQTNLNREGLIITKTKTLGVEAYPSKHKLSDRKAWGKMKYWYLAKLSYKKNKRKCRDSCDEFPKSFCLFIVHIGVVNKCHFNASILENYQTALDGMKIDHDFFVSTQAPEIYKAPAPPVEIALDRNNISILEKAILSEYQTSESSMYSKIKSSLFYGLMHDGITKFAKEYNVYLLKDVLIEIVATFTIVENSVHSVINSKIQRLVSQRNSGFQKYPPNYFNLGKLG